MVAGNHPSKDVLLQPLPLTPSGGGAGAPGGAVLKIGKRTTSFNSGANASSTAMAAKAATPPAEKAAAPVAAAAKKLPPKLAVSLPGTPQLPSSFPATPTAHMALAGGLHKERAPSPVGGAAAGTTAGATAAAGAVGAGSLSASGAAGSQGGHGVGHGSGVPAYGLHSPLPGAHHNRFAPDRAERDRAAHDRLGESAQGAAAGAPAAAPAPTGAKRLSHLSEVGHAGEPLPGGLPPRHDTPSPTGSASGAGAAASGLPLQPSLKVALPAEPDFEAAHGGGGDIMYSPSTPAAKSGMKERMKFYFQRQAGTQGGL